MNGLPRCVVAFDGKLAVDSRPVQHTRVSHEHDSDGRERSCKVGIFRSCRERSRRCIDALHGQPCKTVVADYTAPSVFVVALGEQRAVAARIAVIQNTGGALIRCSARVRTHAQRAPQTGVEITVAEHLLQGGEGRFAGAVAGGDVIQLVGVMQRVGNLLDDWILRYHQAEPASNKVNVRIDLGRLSNYGLNAGVRAAHHQHQAVRRVDGQRQLLQFFGSWRIGNQGDQRDAGCHFRGLVDQLNIGARKHGAGSIKIDEGKVRPFAEKFGDVQVSALTTGGLQAWRDRLVHQPAADADITDAKRRDVLRASQGTANRVWAVCRAALNHAFRTGRVDTDLAWRRIQPFQDVDEARKRFLSVAEANKLLGACKGSFRDLVQAALLTGLRPGELVRLTVGQFQGTRLEVSAGKTGKSRFVPLTTQGVAIFKKLAKGRPPEDLILSNAEMKSWTRMQIARAMRDAVTAAKLKTPAVFYDLRRSYGSLLANAQASDATIAHALGHADTRMTRRHYAHLLDSVVAAELQAKLPTFKARRSRKDTV